MVEMFIDVPAAGDGSAQTQIAHTAHDWVEQSPDGPPAPTSEHHGSIGASSADSRCTALQAFRKSVLARKRQDKLVMLARGQWSKNLIRLGEC
jgi:hypothetical protein